MRQLLGDPREANDRVTRARDLVDQAFETPSRARCAALARQALELWPDCADAYLLLADEEPSRIKALKLLEEAVAAGERAIGAKQFQDWVGHYWGIMDTRPYMRARHALANELWMLGRRDEAIDHYREMLRLNPNDNQGIRYILINCLLELQQDRAAEQLLREYQDDGSAEWAYSAALLAYRREGDSEKSREALKDAMQANRYVPEYFLGNKLLPDPIPDFIERGGETEAISYAVGGQAAWKATPGAVSWMRQALKMAPRSAKAGGPHSRKRDLAELKSLPQAEDEIWQVDVRRFSTDLEIEGNVVRPWAMALIDMTSGVPLAADMAPERPTEDDVIDRLVESMLVPTEGDPRRPAVIEMRLKTLHGKASKQLAGIGVAYLLRKKLEAVEEMMAAAAEQFAPGASPPPTDDPAELPQETGEIWQADLIRLDTWLEEDADVLRPWCVLVLNASEEFILANELLVEDPNSAALERAVLSAMLRPLAGKPHRPGMLEVRTEEQRAAIRPRLAPLGVECVVREKMDVLDEAVAELSKHLSGTSKTTALLDVPGMTVDRVRGYFEAAAEFYRQAPWRFTPSDAPFKIECSKFESGPWYAAIMGQMGIEQGLALYDDRDDLEQLLSGELSDEEAARGSSGFSVLFGEAFEMSARDVNAAEKYGWPVAGPEAFPAPMRINRGLSIRLPLAWELELLEGCLRAIPQFVKQGLDQAAIAVPVATGSLEMKLEWMGEQR